MPIGPLPAIGVLGVLVAVHGQTQHLAVRRHLAELRRDLAVLDDADRLGDHRRDGREQAVAEQAALQVGPAGEVDVGAAGTGDGHHAGGRFVEEEQAVPWDQHVVEEQHAVLLVQVHEGVAPGAVPAADGLAGEDLQALAVAGDAEGQDEARVVAREEGRGQRDVALVAVHGRRRELLAAADDDAFGRLFDDVQGDLFVLGHRAPLVLRLRAAVDLRVTQRVGEEEVVVAAVLVVVDDVLAEVAVRVLERAEDLGARHHVADVRRQDVRAAAELAPGQHVPELAVDALAVRVLAVLRQQPGEAACARRSPARRRSSRRGIRRCSAGRRPGPAR